MIKWKSKQKIDDEKAQQEQEKADKEKYKDKDYDNLSVKEQNDLIKTALRMLGLIK